MKGRFDRQNIIINFMFAEEPSPLSSPNLSCVRVPLSPSMPSSPLIQERQAAQDNESLDQLSNLFKPKIFPRKGKLTASSRYDKRLDGDTRSIFERVYTKVIQANEKVARLCVACRLYKKDETLLYLNQIPMEQHHKLRWKGKKSRQFAFQVLSQCAIQLRYERTFKEFIKEQLLCVLAKKRRKPDGEYGSKLKEKVFALIDSGKDTQEIGRILKKVQKHQEPQPPMPYELVFEEEE